MFTRLKFSASVVMGLSSTLLASHAAAQSLTPPPGATYGQPLPVPPSRPLYYAPFNNYDLLYGYSRGALTARQPIGHEHIPLGTGGYIYRPVYATPPQAPPAAGPPMIRQTASQQPYPAQPAGASILRQLPDAPPPAPESVIQAQQPQPKQVPPKQVPPKQVAPAGPREF